MKLFLFSFIFFSSIVFADAQETFFKLKSVNQFWRQLIDGKDQMYGERVYDEGFHGGHVEPGFLQGATEASDAAPELFPDNLSLDAYVALHTKATAYQAKEKPKGSGFFATIPPDPNGPRIKEVHESLSKDQFKWMAELSNISGGNLEQCHTNVRALSDAMASKYNNEQPIHRIELENSHLIINFLPSNNIANIADKIFDDFNKNQNKNIELISQLYRELELLHYFQDGNTRTNLILMNWLLAREGLNPVILQEPALPIFLTQEQSIKLLQDGMEEWRKEATEQNQERHDKQAQVLKEKQDDKKRMEELKQQFMKKMSIKFN